MKVKAFKKKWKLSSQEMEIAAKVAKSSIDHYVSDKTAKSSRDESALLEMALDNLDLIWETKRLWDRRLSLELQELYQIAVKRLDSAD